MKIEDFLIDNNFQLDSFYNTNKRYCKEITNYQTLYVRFYSDTNKIIDVEYEHKSISKFDKDSTISFETIETIEQIENLLKALQNKKYERKI